MQDELQVTLRDFIIHVMNEREDKYTERYATQEARYRERFDAQELRYKERFEAQEEANKKVEINATKWMAATNEWRGAMDDREVKFAQKIELVAVADRIIALEKYANETRGRSGGLDASWLYLIQLITIIGVVVSIIIALRS